MDHDHDSTVCRCNNIEHETVARAIRDGARSIPAVAVKTGATTGYCGGSCTCEIQEMIEAIEQEPSSAKVQSAKRKEQG